MNGKSITLEYMDLYEGLRSDSRGLEVLREHGFSNHHKARQVREDDFRNFDVIFAFDESNVADLNEFFRPADGSARAKVELFGTYDPKGKRIINNPYYGNILDFGKMFDHINRCCEVFLKQSY